MADEQGILRAQPEDSAVTAASPEEAGVLRATALEEGTTAAPSEEAGVIRAQAGEEAPASGSILDNITHRIKVATGLEIPSSVDPSMYYPDDDVSANARAMTEHYQQVKSAQSGVFKADIVPPPEPPPQGMDYVRDFTNFLFGDAAAAVGVSWDKSGVNAKLDIARSMWSNHPYRAGISLVADAGPALVGAYRLARAFHGAAADIDAGELVAKGLADSVESYATLDEGAQTIVQGQAKKIAETAELRSAVDSGTATRYQTFKHQFNEAFGNSYLDAQTLNETNPTSAIKDWHDRVGEMISGKGVTNLLDLADDINPNEGAAILHAIRDPAQLSELSPKARELALQYSAEGRQLQKEALAEGFIDQETVDKVGDIWFSTLRQDSPMFEEGASTKTLTMFRGKSAEAGMKGNLGVINIPRTSSPNLKSRGMDKAGVDALIKRQKVAEALDAGTTDKALKLLKGSPEEAEVSSLISAGKTKEAKAVLGKEGFIVSNPKDLVVKSLVQQKLLLENFRTLRDVALNPAITKSREEVAAMSKATARRMVSLDTVQNAGVLRRMVAVKSGTPGGGELGFIDRSLFHEVARAADHSSSNQYASLLEFATSMLKTAKTALNPFTHVQNTGGNGIFLWMAGMDMTPENYAVGRQAWKSIWDFQNARKSGQSLENIADLGKLKSKIKGAEDIDIAKEMINPILSGHQGLLDVSSMEASEGIPIMNRLYEKAGDHQALLKSIIEQTQKMSKKSVKGLSVEKMSAWYMAEDSAAKLTYYLHLRQRGLTPLASANEVARRLPMYGTVGHSIASLRKAAVPWISFPTETTRIMKNNMMDHPLRTAMVMHGPNLAQAGVAMGPNIAGAQGMSPEEVAGRREQNPMWAQKTSGIVVPPSLTDFATNDVNKGQVRTFLMDILPHLSVMPSSEAAAAGWQEKTPMGLGNPFPIISGFTDALTGKGQFGQDIATDPNSVTSKFSAIVLRTLGTLAPPVLQKYFMNPELPSTYYRAGIDLGQYTNPSTGETGSPIFDAVLNNSIVKSYGGSPQMQISNERFGDRRTADFRGRLGRELSAWMRTGNNEPNVISTLQAVQSSFDQETPNDLALSKRKYKDWVKLHARDLLKHPAFKGISKTQFLEKIDQGVKEESANRTPALQAYVNALRQGFHEAGSRKSKDSNPLTEAMKGYK